ncbi:MAG TPA: hydrogenase small subunit [Anaeromyxobacter sp.]|nr:hydrogenase small subunit [Anaeromyxobacter sp.]
MADRPTLWESMQERRYSRRDFMELCSYLAAAAGISATALPSVVRALESKPRPPVVWLHFQECTCCSESFIRSTHPLVADLILDRISLDYSETLQAAAGEQAEAARDATMAKHKGQYILTVEGAIPTEDDGVYCCVGGRTARDIVTGAAAGAAAVVAWGSCASNGCIQAARPNPTGAKPVHKLLSGKPVVNVPGCPPIAEVMAGTIVHLLAFGRLPELDGLGRPRAFYSRRVHDTCYRRPNYDAGLFVESFDDQGARQGHCLYKMGCRGPVTYNACGVTRWNGGTSYPIQSGHGCLGCSEAGFWDNGPFYSHLPAVAGFGVESSADKIGLGLGAVTAAGVLAHAIATQVRQAGVIREHIESSAPPPTRAPGEPSRGEEGK